MAEPESTDEGADGLAPERDGRPPTTLDVNHWSLAVDGTAAPVKFLAHAASPAVVRT